MFVGIPLPTAEHSRPFAFHSFSFALKYFLHPRPSAGAQRICGHLRENGFKTRMDVSARSVPPPRVSLPKASNSASMFFHPATPASGSPHPRAGLPSSTRTEKWITHPCAPGFQPGWWFREGRGVASREGLCPASVRPAVRHSEAGRCLETEALTSWVGFCFQFS